MTSIVLLNLGAGQANHVIAIHAPILNGPFWVTSAILITCAAGLVFGLLSLSIRIAVTKGITPEAAVTAIAICGPLSLAPIAIFRSGLEHCLTMSGHDFSLTLANGLFNTAAFLCLSRGLQRTTILHANMVNASQIAMAAVAGVLLFAEPLTGALLSGALLTMIGVVLVARPMATVPAASTFSRAEVPGPSLSVPTAALMEKEI
jgi:drug/metabolite transporter (DMT)-like permease